MPSSMKQNAVDGAMRPGCDVPTEGDGSRNSISSRWGFQPKRYSLRLSAPSKPSATERVIAATRQPRPACAFVRKVMARPPSISPNAVLAFMVTKPGKTVLSVGMLKAHPYKTEMPTRHTRMPVKRANRFWLWPGITISRQCLVLN